jgi:nicotinate-nucleotide pyrophosphorylase (carboxylating)
MGSTTTAMVPPAMVLDPLLRLWLQEDIGRGDRTTQGLGDCIAIAGTAQWVAKAPGVIAGLPIAQRVFHLLDATVTFEPLVAEGAVCEPGTAIAQVSGPLGSLLTGERVALNLAMRLSGIATATRQYCDRIADLPAQLVDTRKTTPGLRLLEKYATWVGGAKNHRMGLDDAVMIKDNHIAAAGGITAAITQIRQRIPYPLTIEVETETSGAGASRRHCRGRYHHAGQYAPRADARSGGPDSRQRPPHPHRSLGQHHPRYPAPGGRNWGGLHFHQCPDYAIALAGFEYANSVESGGVMGRECRWGEGEIGRWGAGSQGLSHHAHTHPPIHPHTLTPHHSLTACAFKSAKSTVSKAAAWVAARTTGGATPSARASCQRAAHRHQRSPGFRPGN